MGRARVQAGNDPIRYGGLDAYLKCVVEQMKMTAEDGQRLLMDFQYMTQKGTKALRG